jgi:Zn-dependent peptidase ImmA (M78 family)/DNA-binding Xre family transcriptional regulator
MNRGAKIKQARESRGYSQSELATLLGVPQAAMSRMENQEMISDDMIKQLCDVLDYPAAYFDKDPFKAGERSSMHYRKRASLKVRDMIKFDSRISSIAQAIDALLDSIEIPEMDIPAIAPTDGMSPSEIAYKIRQLLNLGLEPVDRIVHVLERHGIIVYFIRLEGESSEKIDGLTINTPKGYPLIIVNEDVPNDRKRFTLAHELGHWVMHTRCPESNEIHDDVQEMQANQFAAEFLMPMMRCKSDFFDLKMRDLPMMKRKWLVSKHAIIHRAKELGCISESTAQYYYITLGRNGERKQETVWVDCDIPVVVQKLMSLHRNALHYSDADLANIMGLYPRQVIDANSNSPKLKLSL